MIDEGGPIRWTEPPPVSPTPQSHLATVSLPVGRVVPECGVTTKIGGTLGHRVLLLASESLSGAERAELQGFTRHVLAEEPWHLRPFALPADRYTWSSPQWSALVEKDGHFVSQAGILLRWVRVNQQTICVAGVGSVLTLPAWRGRGLATAALQKATDFAQRRLMLPFALAICPEAATPFLLHQGWQIAPASLLCEQPNGRVPLMGEVALVLSLARSPWPEGTIDLNGSPW
jgi:GNAT superfamily N-acetyltransferase